ncbi:hypothetical protein [Aquipuribacter hungaricus]|uniref:Uncharacterized protein n=1 Tax=Aquipuribacter hungaricus TaxID=545624 RepID=A0ABV7WHB9_9MICO
MSRLGVTATRAGDTETWSRQRLLGVLTAVAVTAVLLAAGLGYTVYLAVAGGTSTATATATASGAHGRTDDTQARRDRIAAAPMLAVAPGDAQPAVPAATVGPVLVIPPATTVGPADVPSGFPRTPEGAVAQLAAIETSVFQAMSIPLTEQIHQQWVLDPGTDPGTGTDPTGTAAAEDHAAVGAAELAGWEITRHVQSFLGTAQMGPEKDLTTTVTVTPAAAQVKGVDGSEWVLACVLLEVRAVIVTEARLGFGHCERMQWHEGRWVIDPGPAPARAPSTWPGSQRSLDAGWRTWVQADPETTTGRGDDNVLPPSTGPGAPWLDGGSGGDDGA